MSRLQGVNPKGKKKKKKIRPVLVYLKNMTTNSRKFWTTPTTPTSPMTSLPKSRGGIYNVVLDLELVGEQIDVQKLIDKIQVELANTLMSKTFEVDKKTTGTINDEAADFILAQFSKIIEFINKKKFKVAVAYFKLVELIYPEYQTNPRFNEINSTRNMVWDKLASRGLI